jgi:putative tryptophan/tyrosine transport system substrate-binding protein
MDRRAFLAGAAALLAAPLAIEAQQTGEVYRIGVLEVAGVASNAANLSAFRQGLAQLGYVEGQNFVIEYRSADGRPGRFSDLATELAGLKVDVIVTRGTPATLAAKQATQTTDRHGVEWRPRCRGHRGQPGSARRECHRAAYHGPG